MHNTYFARRKEFKKAAHKTMRGHYLLLVFLMLVMTIFGTEYQSSLSGWGEQPLDMFHADGSEDNPGNMLSDRNIISRKEVLSEIGQGDLEGGNEKAEENAQALKEKFSNSKALGLTNGVLALFVNSLLSGRLFAHLAQTIRTITRSDRVTGFIFVIGSFLWYALAFYLLKNVYSAVIRRAYLTAGTYQHLTMSDVTWFAVVRKWLSACKVMFVKYVYQLLWSFTVIGGVIKLYSYWAVPWIVAENPSASPKEVITLSRRMMDGHKLELLKYQITFLGWHLLSALTSGISAIAYSNAYILAAESEFYAAIREEMLAKEPDTGYILNDPFLFKPADRIALAENYFDVVEEITDIEEKKVVLSGWRRQIADWFGIWLYNFNKKKAFDEQQERCLTLDRDKQSMQGTAYPQRLNPLWKNRKETRPAQFSYIRNYTVWTLLLLFILFGFIGWSWEVALHFMQTGEFTNRGTMYGPWLPIYGSGGIVVLILCNRFRKNPIAEFFSAVALCGTLEYVSAWLLERKYNQRWWSYDGYFLNLHGRICAEGLLIFGIGCCAVVYLAAPAFDHLISKVKRKIIIALCIILGIIYSSDLLYSIKHPNMAKGAIESQAESEVRAERKMETRQQAGNENRQKQWIL